MNVNEGIPIYSCKDTSSDHWDEMVKGFISLYSFIGKLLQKNAALLPVSTGLFTLRMRTIPRVPWSSHDEDDFSVDKLIEGVFYWSKEGV